MKRLYFLSLLLIISLSLCACESDEIFGDYSLTYSYNSNTQQTASSKTEEVTDYDNKISSNSNISSGHKLLSFVDNVNPGEKASIKIEGTPKTEYSIAVFYSSGQSKSKDLLPKVSDSNGIVSWEWRVGINTKPGTYNIIISQNGKTVIKTDFTIK